MYACPDIHLCSYSKLFMALFHSALFELVLNYNLFSVLVPGQLGL